MHFDLDISIYDNRFFEIFGLGFVVVVSCADSCLKWSIQTDVVVCQLLFYGMAVNGLELVVSALGEYLCIFWGT